MTGKPADSPMVHSMTAPVRSVRVAVASDLSFLVDLQKRWSNNLGFLTRPALAQYIQDAQALLVVENGQPAGYLTWTCTRIGLLRIPQVALDPAVLRSTIGTKIVNHLKRAAIRGDCSIIRLRSRSDLPANLFWPTLGFRMSGVFANPSKRNLPLFEWTMPLLSPDDIATGLLTAGKSFRPLLRSRSKPNPRPFLIQSEHQSP